MTYFSYLKSFLGCKGFMRLIKIKIKNLMMTHLNKILFFNELYLFLFINLKFILNKLKLELIS